MLEEVQTWAMYRDGIPPHCSSNTSLVQTHTCGLPTSLALTLSGRQHHPPKAAAAADTAGDADDAHVDGISVWSNLFSSTCRACGVLRVSRRNKF